MKKYIVSLLCVVGLAHAGLVNAVAIIVNDSPITLYDIDKTMQEKNLSKNDAARVLIDEKIYQQEVQKHNVAVDIFDVESFIQKLAAQNKMSTLDFKSLVRQQQDYGEFEKKIKEQILHQKLVKKISEGNLKYATDDDIKIYYENNLAQFHIPNKIDVVAYVSKNKAMLSQIQKNPMFNSPEVVSQELSLMQDELPPQVKYIVNSTPIGQFSAIFAQNQQYNMFFIKEKKEVKTLTLDEVKEQIFQQIMQSREESFLNEYFETQRITANIKIVR